MHVRLEHGLLVLLAARVERVAAEAEAGVVDEDVEPAERLDRRVDEALAARGVGDVELERDLGLELVDAAGAAGDLRARLARARARSRRRSRSRRR